jgi:hypothetical protein
VESCYFNFITVGINSVPSFFSADEVHCAHADPAVVHLLYLSEIYADKGKSYAACLETVRR